MALVEDMATGLPLVGTMLGDITEVIEDEVNGFHVPPDNSDQQANALIRLLGDEGLDQKMGKKGKKFIRKSLQ